MSEERSCGSCSLCCKLIETKLPVPKPAGKWCQHCAIGKGCQIYDTRPDDCRRWRCGWLRNPHAWDDSLRPDRCGFIIVGDETGALKLICDKGLMKASRRQQKLRDFRAVADRVWPGAVVVTTV